MTRSYERLGSKTFSTKRSPAISGGKRGAPAVYLTGVKGLPLYPIDETLAPRDNLETLFELKETIIFGDLDVLEGDFLVDDGKDFRIRAVGEYEWFDGTPFYRLILEEDKPSGLA